MRYLCMFKMKLKLNKYTFCKIRTLMGSNYICNQRRIQGVGTQYFPNTTSMKFLSTTTSSDEDLILTENYNFPQENTIAKKFVEREDDVLKNLTACASVEEVLGVFQANKPKYKCVHYTRTILILYELYKIYYFINGEKLATLFISGLLSRKEFQMLLMEITQNLNSFNVGELSQMHYNLNKIGLNCEHYLIDKITTKLKTSLAQDFSLPICSRFVDVVCTDHAIRAFYVVREMIPTIIKQIETCDNVADLHYLTICLKKMERFTTKETLRKYTRKIAEFLASKKMTGNDYQCILKVILFLNLPQWRSDTTVLTSQCILLVKNKMEELNISELISLYKVFFRNQEPGKLLNVIQRCALRFLQMDDFSTNMENRLRLFSSLIYFSSPNHRIQYQKMTEKYVKHCETFAELTYLRKILSYIKLSDRKLCDIYMTKMLGLLQRENSIDGILAMCDNYMNFNIDIDNYRHWQFEQEALLRLQSFDYKNIFPYSSKVCSLLIFLLIYGKKNQMVDELVEWIIQNHLSLNKVDVLKLSQCLSYIWHNQLNKTIEIEDLKRILKALRLSTEEILKNDIHLASNSVLLRANLIRFEHDSESTNELLLNLKQFNYVSSKMIENATYTLRATNALIPEVINKMTKYTLDFKDNIVGFNAEKILFLCYNLGYYPFEGDDFFTAVTDIIIRDQERLSGLSFLQSALSLCFFNRLPTSFVKQIFNLEFLEKLDLELDNCYSKDVYPQRVRNNLMQLNRAVCVEYPECNIPWFHQKYIEENYKKKWQQHSDEAPTLFQIKYNIDLLLKNHSLYEENFETPYGYLIHFVFHFNGRGEIIPKQSEDVKTRLAVILVNKKAFTRFYIQLTGVFQLMKRHLEIFGYKVAFVNSSEWRNLLYAKERLDFVENLLWPKESR